MSNKPDRPDRPGLWRRLFGRRPAPAAPAAPSPAVQILRLPPARNRVEALGYEGASVGKDLWGWAGVTSAGPNAELSGGIDRLRNRVRDLERNDPWARKAIREWTAAICGTGGITPRCKTGEPALDARVDALFAEWADEVGFLAAQLEATRGMVRDGEHLTRRIWSAPTATRRVPLRLQLLEPDYLDSSQTSTMRADGSKDVLGVAVDAIGEPVGYYLFQEHPGEWYYGSKGFSPVRVAATDIAHLRDSDRSGQTRGLPWATPVIAKHRKLDDWLTAELERKRTEACIAGVMYGGGDTLTADAALGPTCSITEYDYTGTATSTPITSVQPGMIARMVNGDSLSWLTPTALANQDVHVKGELRAIAAGWGLPYELLTGDLSGVNFSSARFGLQGFRRSVKNEQDLTVARRWCRPVWQWFCEAAILAGLIPDRHYPATWTGPRFEEVDREKDANADKAEMRAGTLTLEERLAEEGKDLGTHLDEIARVNAALDERGISLDSDPRRQSGAGQAQPLTGGQVSEADTEEGAVAVAGAEAVQDTALNGAQVASLLEIVSQVAAGTLPVAAAKAMIRSAFPAISDADVNAMVDSAAANPRPPAPAPAPPA